ncbi:MAG: type II toxin-antitoxin system PemK/MazF family toxin [Planctomycetes bacterium]|nr:type II toxin-antitoxin system PemK/MazF family toxin [Planctomycetota bacterium]
MEWQETKVDCHTILIVQNDVGNQYSSTTIVAAITGTLKKFPVTVILNRQEGGLNEPSMVNMARILTIDKNRLLKKLGNLSVERLCECDQALKVSLGV